jgi:competence protein ComGF
MAGLKRKLKGSTLVESIVAMVIILTCASIAFSALARKEKGLNSMLRTQAEMNISYVVAQAKSSGKLLDNSVDFVNMHVNLEILNYKNYKSLKVISCEAFTQQNELICDYKEIVNYEGSN